MKLRNKLLAALCLALIACLVVPAVLPESFSGVVTAQAAKAKLSKSKASIYNGKTLKLKVKNNRKKVIWSSSDPTVATVSQKGKVKAKKPGVAVITAQVGQKSYTCTVTVKPALKASDTKLTIKKDDKKKVTLTWYLTGKVTMENSNAKVIKCSLGKFKGKKAKLTIKALQPGTATVTITNSKTSDIVKIAVTVPGSGGSSSETGGKTQGIVDKTSVTVARGKTAQVKVTWPYEDVDPINWYDNTLIKMTWGKWNGTGWPLTIQGLKAGRTEVMIRKGDKKDSPIVATISVTVK